MKGGANALEKRENPEGSNRATKKKGGATDQSAILKRGEVLDSDHHKKRRSGGNPSIKLGGQHWTSKGRSQSSSVSQIQDKKKKEEKRYRRGEIKEEIARRREFGEKKG